MMRELDTMFSRTALLILGVVCVLSLLFFVVQRNASLLPAVRTAAITIADLMVHDESMSREAQPQGPGPADWRDRALAWSPAWRTFSSTVSTRLGPDTRLEIRSGQAGPVVWARLPGSTGWISRQIDLPRPELRGALFLMFGGAVVAVLVGAAWLARQLTVPLRKIARLADRVAAGEAPTDEDVGGPAEIRHVQNAFVRLWRSLRSAEHEREALLAGVSHDLRSPIGRMRLALSLYGEQAEPRLVEELEHDLNELEQFAGQFIAYARSNYEEVSSPAVVDEIVGAAIDARGKDPVIEWHGAAPVPASVEARNVRRAVENLIDNAIRHGVPPISVRTEQKLGQIAIVVRDAGAGIPVEDQEAVLQPFVRLDSRDGGGSGLGLAIVNRIARRHRGSVSMTRGPDGFEVRLTLAT